MKALILTLAIALGGCSYATVNTHRIHQRECTTHYTAPVADTAIAVPATLIAASAPFLGAFTCCGGGNGGGSYTGSDALQLALPFIAIAAVSGLSAAHGYREVAECRESRGK